MLERTVGCLLWRSSEERDAQGLDQRAVPIHRVAEEAEARTDGGDVERLPACAVMGVSRKGWAAAGL